MHGEDDEETAEEANNFLASFKDISDLPCGSQHKDKDSNIPVGELADLNLGSGGRNGENQQRPTVGGTSVCAAHVGIEPQAQDEENFFDRYGRASEAAPEVEVAVEGGWRPDLATKRRDGELELEGCWEKPVCSQCGREDGEEGGGRYRRDEDGDHFFCGRCWQAWDEEARRKMMMAYAPTWRDSFCGPCPVVDCPPPPAEIEPPAPASFGDDDFDFGSEPSYDGPMTPEQWTEEQEEMDDEQLARAPP